MGPRGLVLVVVGLMLVAAACGGDDTAELLAEQQQQIAELEQELAAATSTTQATGATDASTTTATSTSTTATTSLPGTYVVAQAEVCVVGIAPGEEVNVRSGPGGDQDIVGTVAQDAAGLWTTGWAALDPDGDEWRQITYEESTAWVFAAFLTPCSVTPAVGYCVNEEACTDTPNVRTGLGGAYDVIGTLATDAVGVPGTGAVAFDERDRPWVQIRYEDGAGWVAGWLLDPEPCTPTECPPSPLPWMIATDAVGPIELGMPITELGAATDLVWDFEEPCAVGCLVGTAVGLDAYVIAHDGTTVDEINFEGDVVAVDGLGVGDSLADWQAAYGTQVLDVTDDGYGGTALWIDVDADGTADLVALGHDSAVTSIRLPAVLSEGCC